MSQNNDMKYFFHVSLPEAIPGNNRFQAP